MELAKNFLDIGLFTNRLDEMKGFYGERLRLPYEELLPLGGGMQQHRYGLLGSVLKINHARGPLPERSRGSGYRLLTIADPRTPMPLELTDPDGNSIELVPAETARYPANRNSPRRYQRGRLCEVLWRSAGRRTG
jgi:hypothetical protein